MPITNFRHWLQEKWYEHCDEIRTWSHEEPKYVSSEYFQRYKWFLKNLYKKEMQHAKDRANRTYTI